MAIIDDIRARYNRTEKEADAFGRIFTVKPLRNTQSIRILEMTESNRPEVTTQFIAAAMIVAIDDVPLAFPKTRGELEAVIDMLDDEGFSAIGRAIKRLNETDKKPTTVAEAAAAAGE